ncbi:hypothetical protein [Streptomyces vilmorinianum]|uniref:hypothetical protein n=1 Tax=Streptomyces vilmorinianum TaxID=3051092 RepID=UPI0010FB167F|nr:hypothetical protein [Streptomyces vilmorinianum]
MAVFELMGVALVSDELGRVAVPLDTGGREVVDLPEGAVVSVALTFRVGEEVDGLAFEEERWRAGHLVATTRSALGGFRPGGPYEIELPAERLPVGRASCGTYDVRGRFTDAEDRELARESHRLRIVHQRPSAAPRGVRRRHRSTTAAQAPPGAARHA